MPSSPDAETLLDTILEGIGLPFYAVDKDWRIYLYNKAAERHFDQPAEKMIGSGLWEHFAEDRGAERGRLLHKAMAERQTLRGEILSRTGRHVSYVMFPLGDGLGVFVRDVTDRRIAEKQREEAEEALRKRTAELEAVLETIPTAVWFTTDRELRHVVGNRRAIELLRIPRELDLSSALNQPSGFTVFRDGIEVPPEARPLHRAAQGETVPEVVLEVRFDNGDRRMLLTRAAPLRSRTGELQGAVAAAADVTERLRYEDHLKLLLNELNHRVKNTLAIVQSFAHQSLKSSASVEEAGAAFEGRLIALASAHRVLTRENWDNVSLIELVANSLDAHNDTGTRFAVEGSDMAVSPKTAITLAMTLHELATNSTKYGALSSAEGYVRVSWGNADGRFRMEWKDIDGPPVREPDRTGFGTRMLTRALASELGGKAVLQYERDGLRYSISAPARAEL